MSKKLFALAKSPIGDLIVGLAFGKLSRVLPVKRLKETGKVIAFWHPKPTYEKHILIVPKKAINKFSSLSQKDIEYVNEIFLIAKDLVDSLGLENNGYTLLTNGDKKQEVNQLHFHLISGKRI